MNWKGWLKEVSTQVVAGVTVLILGSIAVSVWPPLRVWAIGHQNVIYAFLALIVGIVIGAFSNELRTLKPTIASKAGSLELDRVANLFWLGSDLQWARQMVDRGSQDKIAHGLKQAYHHSSELGLSSTSAGQQLLDHVKEVEKLPPQLKDTQKSWVVGLIDSDVTSFSNLMIQHQPNFRPDPYHS